MSRPRKLGSAAAVAISAVTLGIAIFANVEPARTLPKLTPTTAISSQRVKPNMLIVLDTSGSMEWPAWNSTTIGNDCYNGDDNCLETLPSSTKCLGGATCDGDNMCPDSGDGTGAYPCGSRTSSRMAIMKRALGRIMEDNKAAVNFGFMTFDQTGYFKYLEVVTDSTSWTSAGTLTSTGGACPSGHSRDMTLNRNQTYVFTLCTQTGSPFSAGGSTADPQLAIFDGTTFKAGAGSTPGGSEVADYVQCESTKAPTLTYTPTTRKTYKVCVAGETDAADGTGKLTALTRTVSYYRQRELLANAGFTVDAGPSATFIAGGKTNYRIAGRSRFTRRGSAMYQDYPAGSCAEVRRGGAIDCSIGGRMWRFEGAEFYQYTVLPTASAPAEYDSPTYLGPTATISGVNYHYYEFAPGESGPIEGNSYGKLRVPFSLSTLQSDQDAKVSQIQEWLQVASNGGLQADGNTPSGPTLDDSSSGTPLNNAYDYLQCYINSSSGRSRSSACATNGFSIDPPSADCRFTYVLFLTDGEPTSPSGDQSACASDSCITSPTSCSCSFTNAAYKIFHELGAKVYVVGFGAEFAGGTNGQKTLRNVAHAGGSCRPVSSTDIASCMYEASDEDTLTASLQSAINSALAGDFSTSPVSVATGSTSTVSSNYALLTSTEFPSWKGHLRAFDLLAPPDSLGKAPEAWDAGVSLNSKAWCKRNVFAWNDTGEFTVGSTTYPNMSAVRFSNWTSGSCVSTQANGAALRALASRAGLSFTATDQEADEVVRFILGDPTLTGDDGTDPETPNWKLMPLFHSTPVAATGSPGGSQPGAAGFKTTTANRTGMVYAGSNSGMLHAFYLESGTGFTKGDEAFAFVPVNALDKMRSLYVQRGQSPNEANQVWGVATSPHVSDVCISNCESTSTSVWRTMLFFGLGPGGPVYHALDVTTIPTSGLPYCTSAVDLATPSGCVHQVWRTNQTSLSTSYEAGMGESWSVPAVVTLDITSDGVTAPQQTVLVGSGYDATPPLDSRGNPDTTAPANSRGKVFWRINAKNGTLASQVEFTPPGSLTAEYALLADVTVAKPESGYLPSAAYIADPGGRIYRSNGATAAPLLAYTADFGSTAATQRPFLYSPAVYYSAAGETVFAAATSSYDLPGGPETALLMLRLAAGEVDFDGLRGDSQHKLLEKNISQICKTNFTKADVCLAGNKFSTSARAISSPKILVNTNNSVTTVQAAYPIYEPAANVCDIGSSYLVIFDLNLVPTAHAEHSMTIDIGQGLRSSGFSVGAGGGELVVGGAGGVASAINDPTPGGSFTGTKKVGWREY